MSTHKSSILSTNSNFWLQFKNLFFKNHQQSEASRFNVANSFQLAPSLSESHQQPDNQRQPEKNSPEFNIVKAARKWRNNWRSFIMPEVASFKYTPKQGLSNIKVSLKNKTSAVIDYVQLKVFYFEEDGKFYKSEYAELFNVSPLSVQTVPVYNSPAGCKLQVCITNIVASAFNLAFSQDSYE
jgi:hypothetical protein